MKTKLLLLYLLRRKPKVWATLWKGKVPVNYLLLVLMALYSFAPAHLSTTTYNSHTKEDYQQLITGIVSDAGGPIPGVIVQVKDTRISTITDEYGQYSIMAAPGDILVFTYPGYETLEILVGDEILLDVNMYESITHLEEAVINAGYYTVKDKERTGSIYRVTAEEIAQQPINNVLDALQGRVPGLEIVNTTGLAGGGYNLRVRGTNSIGAGNDPLIIIDGVPFDASTIGNVYVSGTILSGGNISPLNTLDPSSIESVEILKDADATAIYGSRGANGVVLITTKKGKKGKTSITADARYTLLSLTTRMDLMNTEQYLAMREKAFANDGFAEIPAYAYDVNGTWDRERYTDWQDYFLGNPAFNSTINLQVSGGSDYTSFHLGVSTTKETTIYPMDYSYNRLSSNFGLNHRSKDQRLKVGLSFNFGKDRNNLPGSDIRPVAIKLSPNAPTLYNEDGNLNWENNQWENPLAALNATYKNNTYNFMANSNMQYEILKGFDFKINIGYNQSHLDEIRLNPHTVFNPSYGLTSANSTTYNNTGKRNSWIIEPQLEGKFKLGKGAVDLLIGATMQEANSEYLALYGVGFPSNHFIENLSSAKTIRFLNDTDSKYKYLAGFARFNYKLHNKYILNLTARRDGSSRFGPGKKFSNFGAIGVAWIFSRENILQDSEWLSFGKLRTSIGITGNDQIGDNQYVDSYTVGGNSYGGNISLSPTRLFNPDYAWERNRKIEAALELGFLRDRLSMEVGYYHNLSDNQLLYIPMPGTTGFSGINGNLNAEVENYGWEFNIHSQNIKGNNFHWTSSLLFSLPYNNLKSFDGLENSTYVNRLVVGMPITITRFYHYTGINPETGVFEFEDYNGDGKISEEDRKYFVDLTPKYYGNFSNQISYKNLSLDFMFQFVKRKGLNFHYYGVTPGLMFNQPTDVLDETSMQIYTSGFNADALTAYTNFKWSNGAVSDASFIRLKTVSLSYRLPKNLIGFADCVINFQGQNLWTLTKYKNGDPEQNTDYTSNLKRISFGFNVTF